MKITKSQSKNPNICEGFRCTKISFANLQTQTKMSKTFQ